MPHLSKMTFRVLKKYFGKWYLNHKAIINFDIRYFGNTVQGYIIIKVLQ